VSRSHVIMSLVQSQKWTVEESGDDRNQHIPSSRNPVCTVGAATCCHVESSHDLSARSFKILHSVHRPFFARDVSEGMIVYLVEEEKN